MTAIDLHFPAFMRAAILYVIAPVNFSQRPSLFERWKRTVLNAHAAKLDKKVLDFKHEGALEIPRREVPKDVLMRIANCPITLSPRFPRAMELDATQSVSDDVSFKYLRAWIQQGGGWISDKLYLGLSRNYRGIYCNESIRQGELLFTVPNHLHISKKTSHKLAVGQHIRNLPDMYFLTYALMYELAHPDSFWKIPLQFVSFDLPKLTLFDSTQTMLNTYHEFDFPYKNVMLEFWRVVEHDFTEIERHLSAAYPLYVNHGWDKFRSCLKYVYSHSIGGTSIVPGVELLNCHLKGSDEETPMRKILGRSRSDMSPDSSRASLSKRVSVGRLMRSLGHRFDNSCTKKADSDYAAGEEIKFMYAAVPDVLNLFF